MGHRPIPTSFRTSRLLLACLLVLVTVLAAGCPDEKGKKKPLPLEQRLVLHVQQFQFIPATVRVRAGKKVVLRIKSGDLTYGIALPALGMGTTVTPKEDAALVFTPPRTGVYAIRCTAPAGHACQNMRGSLVVR